MSNGMSNWMSNGMSNWGRFLMRHFADIKNNVGILRVKDGILWH